MHFHFKWKSCNTTNNNEVNSDKPDRKRLDCSSLEISLSGIFGRWGRLVTCYWSFNWSRHQTKVSGGNIKNAKTNFVWWTTWNGRATIYYSYKIYLQFLIYLFITNCLNDFSKIRFQQKGIWELALTQYSNQTRNIGFLFWRP